jgi:hypothetical protein
MSMFHTGDHLTRRSLLLSLTGAAVTLVSRAPRAQGEVASFRGQRAGDERAIDDMAGLLVSARSLHHGQPA